MYIYASLIILNTIININKKQFTKSFIIYMNSSRKKVLSPTCFSEQSIIG